MAKSKQKAKKVKKGAEILDPRLAKALANTQRVEILSVLSSRQISPVAYEREYGGTLASIAYHFKVLENCGCIELAETVKRRGALEHVYRCTKRPLLGNGQWKRLPLAVRGGFSGATLHTLVARAWRAIQEGTFDNREDRHLSWAPVTVDARGWREAMKLFSSIQERIEKIEARSAARMAKNGDQPISVTVGLVGFESPAEGPN